jgi:hypothetical protein
VKILDNSWTRVDEAALFKQQVKEREKVRAEANKKYRREQRALYRAKHGLEPEIEPERPLEPESEQLPLLPS